MTPCRPPERPISIVCPSSKNSVDLSNLPPSKALASGVRHFTYSLRPSHRDTTSRTPEEAPQPAVTFPIEPDRGMLVFPSIKTFSTILHSNDGRRPWFVFRLERRDGISVSALHTAADCENMQPANIKIRTAGMLTCRAIATILPGFNLNAWPHASG